MSRLGQCDTRLSKIISLAIAFAIEFRSVNDSFSGTLPLHHPTSLLPDILPYLRRRQYAPPKLRYRGGDDHLFSDTLSRNGSHFGASVAGCTPAAICQAHAEIQKLKYPRCRKPVWPTTRRNSKTCEKGTEPAVCVGPSEISLGFRSHRVLARPYLLLSSAVHLSVCPFFCYKDVLFDPPKNFVPDSALRTRGIPRICAGVRGRRDPRVLRSVGFVGGRGCRPGVTAAKVMWGSEYGDCEDHMTYMRCRDRADSAVCFVHLGTGDEEARRAEVYH
ncbi:hypothetical protein EVAR_52962_1 [Eumeta japonica]|uniref:Uncharacterized protein n=1 Tax=Eumeta variegata TaxID=151549 RepID=A0A4C1YYT3_EUMVA|nr:hypothetical protein EVAR_52962_1 [Eumeta japonica]